MCLTIKGILMCWQCQSWFKRKAAQKTRQNVTSYQQQTIGNYSKKRKEKKTLQRSSATLIERATFGYTKFWGKKENWHHVSHHVIRHTPWVYLLVSVSIEDHQIGAHLVNTTHYSFHLCHSHMWICTWLTERCCLLHPFRNKIHMAWPLINTLQLKILQPYTVAT